MHHAVYGTGYLATVISSCLADFGLPVTSFHEDTVQVSSLARDETPYYEKNLKEVVRRNVRSGRLTFSHDLERTCRKSAMTLKGINAFTGDRQPQHLSLGAATSRNICR